MNENDIIVLIDALKDKVIAAHRRGEHVSFETNVFTAHEMDMNPPTTDVIGKSYLFRIGTTPKNISK
ncbi:hypothetical protein [Parapedobacter indicus]|uniref:Uncharacterized protein n=1 Tax=Parapedobacter indicus TaxID=1477437 RepID=A0A1I3E2R8_9SPHI|nr:hypothetical protein [Parapedobacter indicus]PPL04940.1 hypothetical protein CLV26_101750 [Parapedobacter indicus]SFH93149.1 hypothetical protein SAMN05444682_101736 [Parapedobacter indicus]